MLGVEQAYVCSQRVYAQQHVWVSMCRNLNLSPPSPSCPRYFFAIGSIDSFERQMDEAQRQLGIPLDAWVPIKWVFGCCSEGVAVGFGVCCTLCCVPVCHLKCRAVVVVATKLLLTCCSSSVASMWLLCCHH